MSQFEKKMAIFSGSTNPDLAQEIADELGVVLGDIKLETFANGEIYARYQQSIRGYDVFLVQSVA
ncbi:MAG: ribose-phosphate pyrophosphokinase-like domain-containing protein [Eggerthellaceae bacterium]|nr:ribose-phosphate pyrophosphokinase-like domain-containing protein [Eggerthellaceae bacterium]